MELPPRSTLDPTNRDIPLFRSFERKDLVKYQAGAVGGFCERSGDEQSRIIIGAVRAYLSKGTTILFLFTEYFFLPSLFSSLYSSYIPPNIFLGQGTKRRFQVFLGLHILDNENESIIWNRSLFFTFDVRVGKFYSISDFAESWEGKEMTFNSVPCVSSSEDYIGGEKDGGADEICAVLLFFSFLLFF